MMDNYGYCNVCAAPLKRRLVPADDYRKYDMETGKQLYYAIYYCPNYKTKRFLFSSYGNGHVKYTAGWSYGGDSGDYLYIVNDDGTLIDKLHT